MNDPRPITIAPVRKSIRVNTRQARAFEVFTEGLGRWWPRHGNNRPAPIKTVILEPRVGGRWYEVYEDGSEQTVGAILTWEPPHRFVMSWEYTCVWKIESDVGSEVEVLFIPEGAEATRIELEHRLFERLGLEGGTKTRESVNGGWPAMLELFKAEAER
jgi:uncharacterized protein YndB with AHSA1/START domain